MPQFTPPTGSFSYAQRFEVGDDLYGQQISLNAHQAAMEAQHGPCTYLGANITPHQKGEPYTITTFWMPKSSVFHPEHPDFHKQQVPERAVLPS